MLFLSFNILDILDVLLVGLLIYQLYKLVKGTVAINIFIGVIAIYLLWKLVEAMQMELLSEILGQFIGVGVIAIIIVFQQELRKFLLVIGTTRFNKGGDKWYQFFTTGPKPEENEELVSSIVKAVENLAEYKLGAILVINISSKLGYYTQTGEEIDAKINQALIESIFQKTSPLHDGALIVVNGRAAAAGCVLPVSDNKNLPSRLGTRHRATLGITEHTDALAICVSEESGKISFAKEGKLLHEIQPDRLKSLLMRYL